MAGQDRFDHVLTDAFGKAAANQRFGHLAGAKAGDARLFLIPLDDRAKAARNFIGRHFDLDFPGKLGIQRWTMLMRFMRMLVVVPMALMIVVCVGLFFGLRCGFESFC